MFNTEENAENKDNITIQKWSNNPFEGPSQRQFVYRRFFCEIFCLLTNNFKEIFPKIEICKNLN